MSILVAKNQAAERRKLEMVESLGEVILGYLEDASTTDVLINPDGRIFVDQMGIGRHDSGKKISASDAETILRLVAFASQAPITARSPLLKNSTIPGRTERISGCIGEGVTSGPMFAIRVPPRKIVESFPTDKVGHSYTKTGEYECSDDYVETLQRAVRDKLNICIAGGTGSGKTSLASMLLQHMANERLIICEDTKELVPSSKDCVQFLAIEGVVSLAELLKVTLRLRPDRVLIGEVRDAPTASVLVQLANTGHRGTLFTMHADGAEEAQRKLAAWCHNSGASAYDIAHTIDIVAYCVRKPGKKPAITQLLDVRGKQFANH